MSKHVPIDLEHCETCIDFDNSSVFDKGSFRVSKTLEAWHTCASATKHADNNSKPLSNQYSILFKQ